MNMTPKTPFSIKWVLKFWRDIQSYISDKTIKKYLDILEINPDKLINTVSVNFNTESKKFVQAMIKHPIIFQEIYSFLQTKRSKLEFLDIYSVHQNNYPRTPI